MSGGKTEPYLFCYSNGTGEPRLIALEIGQANREAC